jgi:hypothetical protein
LSRQICRRDEHVELNASRETVTQWWFTPEGNVVVGDMLFAQKIALETMDLDALAPGEQTRSSALMASLPGALWIHFAGQTPRCLLISH